jgi:ketosteroid isomerase-like protein
MLVKAFLTSLIGRAVHSGNRYSLEKAPMQGGADMKNYFLEIEDSAMEEWRKGNPLKWIGICTNDIVYIDPALNAPIVGRPAFAKYIKALEGKIFYDGSEYVRPHVAVYGDLAVLTYNYHSLSKDPAGINQRTSFWNTTEVYLLKMGEWKIIHTHRSYIGHRLPESLVMTIPVLEKEAKPLVGEAAEIMRLEIGALERWRNGDPTGALEISAPDVTYFDSDTSTRLNGLPELKKEYDKITGKFHYDSMEFICPRFYICGVAVILFYQFFATTLNPDGTIKERTPWNCTKVYAKSAGGWKTVHSHWSLIKGWRKDGGV